MAWFRVRDVLEELEARLVGTGAGGAVVGKAERKRYSNGEERLKVRASGLRAPDGAPVEVRLAGEPIASMLVGNGRVALTLESPSASVPPVRSGQAIELVLAGSIVASGQFSEE